MSPTSMSFGSPDRLIDEASDAKGPKMPKITPWLWFDTEGEEAARFYVSLFPNSRITSISHYGEAGPGPRGTAMTVAFELDGRELAILNGGPSHQLSEAFSLMVECADQDEVDRYWNALSEGGAEGPCGWLKDRFGVSWQIVPAALMRLIGDPDPERAQRAMKAMLGMSKIVIAELEAAADGR
jgi:predicted 3-demethylubiquinone-9 3-methyltransferase (glyoxalase superfamily)